MSRYPEFSQRKIDSLNGTWQFCWLGETVAFDDVNPLQACYESVMTVPGVFDTLPELVGQRGTGLYRRTVAITDSCETLLLQIEGMGLRGRIFWDGAELLRHELAYSNLTVPIRNVAAGLHELVIAADNRFVSDPPSLFYPNFDFYGYGGIYRDVSLHHLPSLYCQRVRVTTIDLLENRVRLDISLGGAVPETLTFRVAFDTGASTEYTCAVVDDGVTLEATVPNGTPWSPDAPNLHTVELCLPDDQIVERFGLRTIEAKHGKILLNGKAIHLCGFNRHEAHPQFGPVLPTVQHLQDLQYMKDMGCNFVRGAHYPQNQLFLDLCDEVGMLVWEEGLGWGDSKERITHAHFGELQEEQLRNMVRVSANHPSVIIWAFLNEGHSDKPETKSTYSRLIKAIREEDSTRLVSYASNRGINDLSLEEVDLVSMNIYPAWIDSPDWECTQPFDRIPTMVNMLAEFCDAPSLKDKPFILSEIGTCALYGWHDPHRAGWSEEFQADYLHAAIRAVFDNPRLSGITIWQLYDMRSFSAGELRGKARSFNNAGVLDEYRRPKLAYQTVKELFSQKVK